MPMADQCVFIRGFQVKRSLFRIKPIRIGSDRVEGRPPVRIFEERNGGEHTSISNTIETLALVSSSSSLATIVYPNHENPQRFQSLRTTPDPLTRSSSSSLDMAVSPNHENPQLYGFQSLHNTPDPFTRGSGISSSSLDTVVHPFHKEPQLIQRLLAPSPPLQRLPTPPPPPQRLPAPSPPLQRPPTPQWSPPPPPMRRASEDSL